MRAGDRWLLFAVSSLLLCPVSGCRREQRQFEGDLYSELNASGTRRDRSDTPSKPVRGSGGPYANNAWGMSEGQRLYAQMNCMGCHAHGGGGMGVPLIDGEWLYGFDDASIFASIVDGRPNGMPSFRGYLSDDQVWQLVAYVKSLGGNASAAAASARDDHMAVVTGPARMEPQPIVEKRP